MRTVSFDRPSTARLESFLNEARATDFSYAEVGASAGDLPPGYDHDHKRVQVGAGSADFETARAALRRWAMYPRPWTLAETGGRAIEEGVLVAMAARAFGLWWLNALRIVYVIDERERFGFGYGTLPHHVERGEERFLVERLEDGSVWYDVRAFSRPRAIVTRLAYPLARRLQRRFVVESMEAMRAAVEGRGR